MARNLFIIISLLLAQLTIANENALKFAVNFFRQQQISSLQKSSASIHKVQLMYESADTVKNELFVYQETNKGFIIVAPKGDDFQVVAYSSSSTFQKDNLPLQFKGLLKMYESIPASNLSGIKTSQNANVIVEPLLNLAGIHLNQFNHPEVGGCPTGCVATAMAQILAYHKYPDHGKGNKCYNAGSYGQQCADFENTYYNWTNPTDADYQLLSKHIGVATEMNYCKDQTGSSPDLMNYKNVLRDNFRMNIYPFTSTPNEYVFLELDQKRPVYVELWGDPGHALVADGYDSNNFLHLNFGWGGAYDGYYLMNTNSTFNVSYTFGTNLANTLFVSPKPFGVDQQDSLNLIAINSKINNKWDVKKLATEWSGVKIIGGKVVELDLSNQNNIKGSIPMEIGNLNKLQKLTIGGNLSGTIPANIFKLLNLKFLYILNYSGNPNLNFSFPADIDLLTNLNYLYLNNCLTGIIPEKIGNLVNLQYLNLFNNSLSGTIPASICNLKKLVELDLTQNKLNGNIPDSIGKLNLLTILQLGKNELTGKIPSSLSQLKKMYYLSLESNQLSDVVPQSITSNRQLTTLNLSNNQLTGVLPEIGDSLTELVSLDISNNKFSALAQTIGKLVKLKTLNVAVNQLTQLPSTIANCEALVNLNASQNQLKTLPVDFALLRSMTTLSLASNQFETIPLSLGYLMNLSSLNMANNKLTGLPDYLSDFNIKYLYLNDNNLSGKITAKLLSKTYVDFYLKGNNFTFSDIPQSDSIRNPLGAQKPVLFSKKIFNVALGDTLYLRASQILPKTHPKNKYSWYEHVDATQATPYTRFLKADSVFSIVATEHNLKKKYFCVITNDSVSKYIYSGSLRLNCIDQLTTDSFQLACITKEEALDELYQTKVLASENIGSKEISNRYISLISPWKVRGIQQWQGSIDKVSWTDLSTTMVASNLKNNIVSISEKELKLFPKTTAYYRNALWEEKCNPQYSDTIKVLPWGKVICDTLLNVAAGDKTIRLDSIEITVPKGTSAKDFYLTVIKSEQQYTHTDSLQFMSPVYDVSLSCGSSFDNPIIIKFKNLNKKNFNGMYIEKYKPAYFDEQLGDWVFYDNANIDFKDSTLTFSTYHLTKLAWFELAHAGYTHIFTNDLVNVIYKYGQGYYETTWIDEYDKLAKKSLNAWNFINNDPETDGTPYFVQDIAYHTQEIIAKFKLLGIRTPGLRFNVYVKCLDNGAAGMTDAGSFLAGRGYIYIDPLYTVTAQDKDKFGMVKDFLKSTLAHEYMHFTQDYYMTVMLSNYFWMEATAPLADRIVWGEDKLTLCEPEYLLKEALLSSAKENSIFDVLAKPWYNTYNIPAISKIAANSADINLASLFLHYMRTYREGDKLNPVKLLKETSYFESWVGYLNGFIKSNLNSDIGTEYENYVKFLFEGSKENFSLFEYEEGEDPLKNFKACLDRSVVNKSIFFNRNKIIEDKLNFSISGLSMKMVQIFNRNLHQKMLTKYVKKIKDDNLKVYVCKYNADKKIMELTDVSQKDSIVILADAFETDKIKENKYMTYLLFINKSTDATYTIDDNISYYMVPDINYFDGISFLNKNSTIQPTIHSIAESATNEVLFDQFTALLYRYADNIYGSPISTYQHITDSTVETSASSSVVAQTMVYNFLKGDLKITHRSEADYGNGMTNIQEFAGDLKNIYPEPYMYYLKAKQSRYFFTTNSTQETINCIRSIQYKSTWIHVIKEGEVETTTKTYTGTNYPLNEVIIHLQFY